MCSESGINPFTNESKNMGKVMVVLLATVAVCGLVWRCVGERLNNTAVSVPATGYTPSFGITWTLILFGVVGMVLWRTLKH